MTFEQRTRLVLVMLWVIAALNLWQIWRLYHKVRLLEKNQEVIFQMMTEPIRK